MTMKVITIETPPEVTTQITVDDSAQIRAPSGKVTVSSLQVGDSICLFPDGSHIVRISAIGDAV